MKKTGERTLKGDKKVIERLNEALFLELGAVNQYWVHYRLLEDWGYTKLAKKERAESIEEMHHADRLVARISFLEGHPNLQTLAPLRIGQNFFDVLADAQRRKRLQVGVAFEEDDACDELVGMLHLFDRFSALLLGELGVTPIFKEPVVNPVLVDSTKFQKEGLVKPLDDFFVAFQCPLSCFLHGSF